MIDVRTETQGLERAAFLHEQMLTFDAHIDIPLDFGSPGNGALDDGLGCFDLVKAARGRLSGAAFSIHATLSRPSPESATAGQLEQETRFELITNIAHDRPDLATLVSNPQGLRDAARDGLFGVVLSLQNAEPLEDLAAIEGWHARGVSMLDFAFIGNNRWTDSARPYPFIGQGRRTGGLTELGKAAVARMNQLGVIVDISQLSSEAIADVASTTRAPFVASHSAPRAMVAVDRNLTDVDMHRVAESGGVVHLTCLAPYLREIDGSMKAGLRALWRTYGLSEPSTIADLMSVNDPATALWDEEKFWDFLHDFHHTLDLDHPIASVIDYVDALEYAVKTIGIDHVGIGSDFNHSSGVVGWMNIGQNLNVTAELLKRGMSEADIARIWAENFLRVWQQVLDGA